MEFVVNVVEPIEKDDDVAAMYADYLKAQQTNNPDQNFNGLESTKQLNFGAEASLTQSQRMNLRYQIEQRNSLADPIDLPPNPNEKSPDAIRNNMTSNNTNAIVRPVSRADSNNHSRLGGGN